MERKKPFGSNFDLGITRKTALERKRAGRKVLRRDGTPEVALILLHVIILTPAATKRQTLDSKLLD